MLLLHEASLSRSTLLLRCTIAITILFTQLVASASTPYEATFNRRQDAAGATTNHTSGRWLSAWTSMPQLTEPANLPPVPFNNSDDGVIFRNATIRQTIRVTAGTSRVRLRLSNAFGLAPLPITAVAIGKPASPYGNGTGLAGSPAVDVSTLRTLTFSGSPNFTVPNGALVVSDAVDVDVGGGGLAPGDELSVSVYLAEGQAGGAITSHPGSRTRSWLATGDWTGAADLRGGDDAASVAHWYFISTLDAWVPSFSSSSSSLLGGGGGTLAIVGDSITDGRGSTTDGNDRWPDALLDRLQQQQQQGSNSSSSPPLLARIAIANQAAGGNRVLADGLGPNALGRFDRDVLAQPGVAYALLFEGVNDIGSAADEAGAQRAVGDALIAAYKQFALRARAAGLPLFGATITPFNAPGFDAAAQPYSGRERERTRQRVNEFVRNSGGVFDVVVDFDAAVRDADDETMLRAEYDSGDYLHLNPAGYRAMADAFPVDALVQFAGGVDGYA
ncbi:extracellular gdsl-like lipase acylhydrolase [Diplodia corticola]|uniref:Extracellular gdsl-like lipase acylhydrolase n=1 Tax=Diplodia corticola TaxID=236234 RepID=A0A1J9SBG3_9PEZI|nr:extracellular gdsl-like lipase acylhydrolase [Diplodia corticola]OJD36925.1 extracellular gdsl-like lipase acylhydrolase [Diplodia corticola]